MVTLLILLIFARVPNWSGLYIELLANESAQGPLLSDNKSDM